MSLETCPECKHLNSHAAYSCIKCGYPIREQKNQKADGKYRIMIGVFFAFVLIIIYFAKEFGYLQPLIDSVFKPISTSNV